ncbi:hypothetical protein CJF30_00003107 [Rutstroemia sp. NJR-2017a BBW]|nr:hypothetical protein CJF30_00003107 [Rutstroemia sp. NJR-2017a BBW]
MTEGAKIWDIKVRSDRWTKIAKENIDSLVLWKNYLNFRQSNFSTFQYDDVREVFITRITSLKQAINKASGLQIQPLYEQLLYVLLRFTVFVRESGFVELAVAIWQSLLELNFYGRNTSLSPDEAVKSLGEFWESEVPRIGETGSLGWHKFLETGDDSAVPEGETDEPEMPLKGEDVFASWVTAERSRAKASRLPARTLDDTVEDDPYRSWVRNTFKQLTQIYPDDDFMEYYLAFEWCNEPDGIKKVAKALLKQHSSNLRLYNAYAMIEWSRGNKDISNSTISASPAAILRTQRYLTSVRDSFLYFKDLLHAVLYTELLALLAYLSSSPSPTEPEPHSPSQGHLFPALQIFNSFSSSPPSPHPLTLHQQSLTRLLHHHTQAGPYRPSLIHTHLHTSLSLSPSNTIFFTLFTALSPPNVLSPISLSTIFTDLLSPSSQTYTTPNNPLPTHLQILHHHLQHHPSIPAGRNAAAGIFKSIFSSTSSSSELTSSPALWKLYLLFLARYSEFLPSSSSSSSSLVGKSSALALTSSRKDIYVVEQEEKQKKLLGVLKSAITRVPWCKEIYVAGVEGVMLGDGKRDESEEQGSNRKTREKAVEKWDRQERRRDEGVEKELKDIWRVTGEKGVRVHVDLEDWWDEEG